MPAELRKWPWRLLDQLPTVFALAVLGAVAWWGFVLLYPSPTKPKEEAAQSKESEKKDAPGEEKTLPAIKLASADVLETAGIKPGEVAERPVGEYVQAHGDIDFNQDHFAHLSTLASGKASKVYKRRGDQVKKGEVLALIEAPELASLKFDLQQTLLTEQKFKRNYDRLKSSGEATSRQALDNAEVSLREARIHLSKDQQSLQNLGLTVSINELSRLTDKQVADRLRTLGIPDTLLQGQDPNTLTNNLLPMYAPFDGMVISRDIVPGEVVNPSRPQFVLADLSRLWIMLHVRLEDAGKLQEGQKVAFHLDGSHEDAPPAQIAWISAAVDEKTRTVPVRAEVENPKGRLLRPGTFGDARIRVRQEKRLVVPTAALQFDGASYVVFLRGASDTEFQPLRVDLGAQPIREKLGPTQEEYTVVFPHDGAKQKIAAGQRIAISGTHVLLSEMQKERIGGED